MPPKSRKRRSGELNLKYARETKQICADEGESSEIATRVESSAYSQNQEVEGLVELLELSEDAIDTDNEDIDPSFDLDSSMLSDTDHMVDTFCDEWVSSLTWEDRASLGLFLSFQLSSSLGKGETEAAEIAGQMIGKSDRK